jgi:hypothetical protein
MDDKERELFLRMFATQGLLIEALVDALGNKGILTADDVAAFKSAKFYEEEAAAPILRRYVDLYNLLSDALGVGVKVQIS